MGLVLMYNFKYKSYPAEYLQVKFLILINVFKLI
jgi:hypothetical protein